MKKTITTILAAILLFVAGFSANQIVNSFNQSPEVETDPFAKISTGVINVENKNDTNKNNLIETVPEETEEVVIDMNTPSDRWYTVNKKTTGTISIEGLRDEPIVTNNTINGQNEYLRKNIEGKQSQNGTLFTAYDAKLGVTNVTTVFGHSMKDGSMFGTLKNFKKLDYVKNNPTFTMSSLTSLYNLKIIAVADVSSNYKNSGWYYPQSTLNEEQFEDFKKEVRNRSYYVIPDEFDYASRYVILSCCDYAFNGERLIIVARIMNENETVDTSSYANNPVVLRANEFYKTYGYNKPNEDTLNANRIANYGE